MQVFSRTLRLVSSAVVCSAMLLGSAVSMGQTQDSPAPPPPDSGAQPATTSTTATTSTASAIDTLRPALAQVNTAVLAVNVGRWKASGGVRSTSQEDIASIQRDLNGTLPPLLDQATASSHTIAPSFAVFRNVDALYDVLLRLTETASLAGAQADAQRLEDARSSLASARASFGNALFQAASVQDAQLARLRVPQAPAVQPAPAPRTVIDDGPAPAATHRRKKKPAATPAPAPPPQP